MSGKTISSHGNGVSQRGRVRSVGSTATSDPGEVVDEGVRTGEDPGQDAQPVATGAAHPHADHEDDDADRDPDHDAERPEQPRPPDVRGERALEWLAQGVDERQPWIDAEDQRGR